MHHRPGDSLIAGVDTHAKQVHRPPVDVAADEVIQRTGETANIECGFWSGDFDFYLEEHEHEQEQDEQSEVNGMDRETEKLMFLREEVGGKGRCLKPGREVV